MAFKDAKRCKARSKTTGKQCKNPAVKGFGVCRMHGAHTNGSKRPGRKQGSKKPPGSGRGAERGNTRAMTTGVATLKMPAHLEALRQMYVERYTRAVANPDPFDVDALERAAGLQAKFAGAIAAPDCPASTLDTLHRLLHRELHGLKVTREQREATSTGTTPAEVIAAIVRKVAERRRELDERGRIETPMHAPAMSAPARCVAVVDVAPGPTVADIADGDQVEPVPVESGEWEEEQPAPDLEPEPELPEDGPAEEPADQEVEAADNDDWFPED